MKKLITLMAPLAIIVSALGQGQVVFNNRVVGVVDAKVTCLGIGIQGDGWVAQLFGGPKGTAESGLIPLLPKATFRTGVAAGYVAPPDEPVTIPGVKEGAEAALQLRVFAPDGSLSQKWAIFTVTTGGGILPPANLIGLTPSVPIGPSPFSCIPEPSTVLLCFIGAAAVFSTRARNGRRARVRAKSWNC